jgi:hypothetical protein
MNCVNHPEIEAVAYCRVCGKAMCQECQRPAFGSIYCAEHVPAAEAAPPSPWSSRAPAGPTEASPGLAFLVGLIPGVGAIYNGQYAKGLIHVVIFGLLISIMNSRGAHGLEPLFGLLVMIWYLYMPFEAYHTAKKRQRGEAVDEFSSLFPLKHQPSGFPVGPVILIAIGVLFLLVNLDVIRMYQVLRYWPVFLIVLGAYMLYTRLSGQDDRPPARQEVSHEQQ